MSDTTKQPNPTGEPSADTPPATPSGPPLPCDRMDIWSRPGKWARQRAYIFLCVNVLVYATLNIFFFWLQNGRVFDFSYDT